MKKRRPSQNEGAGQNRVAFSISRTSPQPPNSRPVARPEPCSQRHPSCARNSPTAPAFAGSPQSRYPSTHAAKGRYSYVGAGSNKSERT